jgi:argininosuccinate lyase
MPQKKNPDVFELARGKSGILIGHLAGMLATLKGLPSAYDKDLQEDKVPVFQTVDTVSTLLTVLAGALASLEVHPERMRSAITPGTMATDLADHLVEAGIPFRQAHAVVGEAVRLAMDRDLPLDRLPREVWQKVHPTLDFDVQDVLDLGQSLSRRRAFGGTAPDAVREQIGIARGSLEP